MRDGIRLLLSSSAKVSDFKNSTSAWYYRFETLRLDAQASQNSVGNPHLWMYLHRYHRYVCKSASQGSRR